MIGEKLGPYEILSPIGSGGMGEVWKAQDTRLGRVVAIKKVKEQHSERFKQEARSIAALNHPNICQIHDIGDDYLVLEYVEGKPLSSPLPEQEAVKLAIQIATALEAAHKKGLIHRDLKPGNIMVSDEGTAKLLDFGLAKLYEQDQSTSNLPTEDFPATQSGAILGTVAYMSPEQARGKPADVRSDIFSFGLVLYEMLSGRRAFVGDSASETIAALLRDEPATLKSSPALERIVKLCLEKNPSERYQTMTEVKTDLEKEAKRKMTASSKEPQPSIAVLPFVNMSGDKEQEYFSDGLAEEIINALTKIPELKVIARTSSFYFRDKDVDISQIRDKLKVQNILEGSVRKSGNRLRVTAQLINTSDESHIWSERYDREMEDIFVIQDEISQAIAEKLKTHLSGDRQLVKHPTGNIEAYNFYLRGRYHFLKGKPENWAKSKECYEQALAIDPTCALAWYGLAFYYHLLESAGLMPSGEAYKQSRYATLKSLEYDETLPEAHSIMGELLACEFDWKGAEQEFNRALELNPKSTDILFGYSFFYLIPMKRFDEALEASKKASEQDPLSAYHQFILGVVFFLTRQYDRAIKQLDNTLELDPNLSIAYMWLCKSYFEHGDHKKSYQILKKLSEMFTNTQLLMPLGFIGYIYSKISDSEEAKKILERLQNHAQQKHEYASSFALIYFSLGQEEKGFDWLDKAAEDHQSFLLLLINHPFLDPLRSHPRYKDLLRKMNLGT